jgi:O-antigen ligase
MYYKYFEGKPFSKSFDFGVNYNSAHSLTIRILSEAGLLGFLVFLIFLRKKYIQPIKNDRNILMFHVISLACIGHFLSKSLKLGGYIDYGTPFFLTLLIVNYIAYRNYVKSK